MEKTFNIPKMKFLWVLMVFCFVSACKKECEKVSDSTLFQFGSVKCKNWDKDTIEVVNFNLFDNPKGQPLVQAPICYSKFVAQLHSKRIGDFELFQEKNKEYFLSINGKNELGIFTKRDTTNSIKFPSIEFISDRQFLIAYVYNGDTVKYIKPCPN